MIVSCKIKMKGKVKLRPISLVKVIFRMPVDIEIDLEDAEVEFINNRTVKEVLTVQN